MNQKKWTPGKVVWRELLVEDVAKAQGYYGELFSWKFEGMGPGGDHYTVAKVGDKGIGGIMRPPMPNIPPCWMSYVSVEDVDETVRRATANGGKVLLPGTDQEGVGRFAVLADPSGAAFNVIRFSDGDPAAGERPPLGAFCWETVLTADEATAKAFYAAVLGWKAAPGPGDGTMFTLGADAMVADLRRATSAPPHWASYVVVEKLEAGKQRVEKLGGQILVNEVAVPTIGRFAVTKDPLGAVLCLFEPAAS
jgi:uncharacterized protein